MPVAVIVDWYGPYQKGMSLGGWWRDGERVLYMAWRKGNVCHYVGLTKAHPEKRLKHHNKVKKQDLLYIGRIVTSGIPGPRLLDLPKDLGAAEHALIFALKPDDNVQKMRKPPDDCVVVYGRIFDRDGNPVNNPPPKFPILVSYDPDLHKSVLLKGNDEMVVRTHR